MTELQILKAARERITDPANWGQGWSAYSSNGYRTSGYDPTAVKFALDGALCNTQAFEHQIRAAKFRVRMQLPREHYLPSEFNDDVNTTHADVLALLDRAIEQCEAEAVS